MEASEHKVLERYEKTKSFLAESIGVILTIIAIVVIFIVASLEGTRPIQASNSESGEMLQMWREENPGEDYPEHQMGVVNYNNRDYYFVIEEVDPLTQEIVSWHFAYDSGLDYIFRDYKYYVLVGISFIFGVFVSIVNYNSTMDKMVQTPKFVKSLNYYQDKKSRIKDITHFLWRFCVYKNQQTYIDTKRSIVESADLKWEDFIQEKIDYKKLARWQRKRLKKIKKIKIIKINSNDLLFERRFDGSKVRILPIGQDENKKRFVYKSSVARLVTASMSGLVAGFGIVVGNWVLGLVFASTIVAAAFGSVISAIDYAGNTLKNRFIAKGDLLIEFYNLRDKFEQEEKEEENDCLEEEEKEEEVKQHEESILSPQKGI